MSELNTEFLDRYQKMLDENPSSRIFAPLAEAYRQNGNLQRALQICRQGLNLHPNFASGWYQLAKIFIARQEPERALEAYKKAVHLAPENIQAHRALAELYLRQRNSKDALKSFKMVLYLAPDDERAKTVIEKLESLTADEYSAETFQIGESEDLSALSLTEGHDDSRDTEEYQEDESPGQPEINKRALAIEKSITQTVTLVDALLVRNEFHKAKSILKKALMKFGSHHDLESRWEVIEQQKDKSLEEESPEIIQPVPPRPERLRLLKLEKLERLLDRIRENKA